MSDENKSNLKIYRAFYQSMSETISCVIVFISESRQICINEKTSDLIKINGILGFMIDKEISELEELYQTENLIRFVDNILMEYSNNFWEEKKASLVSGLFDYLNGFYFSELDYRSVK